MDNLAATQAQFIASGCPGCQMQLNVGVQRSAACRCRWCTRSNCWTGPMPRSRLKKIEDEYVRPDCTNCRQIIGKDGVLPTPEDLVVYSYDGTFEEHRPDIVVAAAKHASRSARWSGWLARERIPVVTRGMGSGLAAASVPFNGGHRAFADAHEPPAGDRRSRMLPRMLKPGIITADLQAEVEKRGLFYPPDPSSIRHSTIGGNIACNAGGPRCLKYGVTGDYVLGSDRRAGRWAACCAPAAS